ncbi:GNAT family N-acetyltransferase [Butyrivibrio sp.]|uniref:GNAT family N-acetyltransferase n=1 Tax=Butyrivibrio sp. TaxID=28121 RepID=UPI0025B8F651|nr:GNAT family N-acetyltransferase [Butyrivibrio sp.]
MEYRIATLDDIDLLTASRVKVLRAANKLDDSVDMTEVEKESYNYYKKALADGRHCAILVMDDGRFIGAGGVSFYNVMPTYHNPSGKKAYIMNMYTDPSYRRQGIAYKTLDMLVNVSKERGIYQISLEATDMGRPLYEKYGFVKMESEMELI